VKEQWEQLKQTVQQALDEARKELGLHDDVPDHNNHIMFIALSNGEISALESVLNTMEELE
jgi:hypothetical protein